MARNVFSVENAPAVPFVSSHPMCLRTNLLVLKCILPEHFLKIPFDMHSDWVEKGWSGQVKCTSSAFSWPYKQRPGLSQHLLSPN